MVQTTKKCKRCKKVLSLKSFGKNSRMKDGINTWCKKCNAAHVREYYQKNRKKVMAYVQKWCERNRERSNEIKRRWERKNYDKVKRYRAEWRKKHPSLYREYKERQRLKKHLDIWIEEIGENVIKSTIDKECDVCGIWSHRKSLYLFRGKFTCVSCLDDYKATSLIPRKKFIIPKRECGECGRMHPDIKHDKCIDCRVREKRKELQRKGLLPW